MLLINKWVNNEIKEEITRYLETNENEDNNPKSVGHWESNPKREIHSITDLSLKSRKSSNEYLTSHLKKNNKVQSE